MDLFQNEALTIRLYKFFGPLILTLSPLAAYAIISVTLEEFANGAKFDLKIDGPNFALIFLFFGVGIWMCRKGYGWFGGKK